MKQTFGSPAHLFCANGRVNCYIAALQDLTLFPPDLMSSSRCSGRPMSQTERQGKQKTGSLSYLTMSLHVAIAPFSFTWGGSSYIGYTRHNYSLFAHSYSVIWQSDLCFAVLCCPAMVSSPECQLWMCPVRKLLLFHGFPSSAHWP